MIKAKAGKKVYYIFHKNELSRNEALATVAIITHERTDRFDILDAKLIGKSDDGFDEYEIGTKGQHFALVRRKEE